MTRDVTAAARAVEAAMAELGWNVRDLAREARADAGTIGDFLSSERWPRAATRGRIEKALGWPAGTIREVAEGAPAPSSDGSEPDPEVADLLANDPTLSVAAREHILNQYRLLQRLSRLELDPAAGRSADREAISSSRELSAGQKQAALEAEEEVRGQVQGKARPPKRSRAL